MDWILDWLSLLSLGTGGLGVLVGWMLGHRRVSGLEESVSYAHLDKLTGLPDRTIIDDVIENATSKHIAVTVAVCDVDGLHNVNDLLGHVAGDQLLVSTAHRLLDLLPDVVMAGGIGGVVARAGGDEFWVITPIAPELLAEAYVTNINGVSHTASLGIASSPLDGSPRHAIQCADIAMYSAKERHTPVVVYDHSLGEPEGTGVALPSAIRHLRRHDDQPQPPFIPTTAYLERKER